MAENRVQFNNIVQNQLPQYVREEYPLIEEFLKQYYIAQEFDGAPIDLIQNIDKYISLDKTTNLIESGDPRKVKKGAAEALLKNTRLVINNSRFGGKAVGPR